MPGRRSPNLSPIAVRSSTIAIDQLHGRMAEIDAESKQLVAQRLAPGVAAAEERRRVPRQSRATLRRVALVDIVRVYQPNAMGLFAKLGHYCSKVWELLSSPPRESNTEGGVLPALFGTVALSF